MKKMNYSFENYGEKQGGFQNGYNKNFEKIAQLSKELADSIRNSLEYTEFMAAKDRLENDEMNKKVLHELREQQLNFQFSPIDDDLERKAKFLNEMYMAVSLNPVISDYLNAEYKFGLIIEEIRKNFEGILGFDDDLTIEVPVRSKYKN